MEHIQSTSPFNATWNQSNTAINPNQENIFLEFLQTIKKIALFIPNILVAACVNPRSETEYESYCSRQNDRTFFTKKVITPDGVPLAANIWLQNNATSDTPTVLLFNPLGTASSFHGTLKAELVDKKCNVVSFDYRGLGTTRRAEDLVVDGESIYQYVTQELGIHQDQVHFYGMSLGGAIALQVKALHPESKGKYVGDRPFKAVFSLLTEKCSIDSLGPAVKKISSFVFSLFLAYPIYLLGWEWDGSRAIKDLQGDKMVIYHPNDFLIPFSASLASEVSPAKRLSLNPKTEDTSTHFAPLQYHETSQGESAIHAVAEFFSKKSD